VLPTWMLDKLRLCGSAANGSVPPASRVPALPVVVGRACKAWRRKIMYRISTREASQPRFSRPLLPFAIAALALPCCGAFAQQPSLDGAWAVGNEKACSTSPYQLQTTDTVWRFTDRKGTVNVEKVVQSANGLYVTETVSSPDQLVGTRWEYRFQGPSRAEVRNVRTQRGFVIVRCPAPPSAPRPTGSAKADSTPATVSLANADDCGNPTTQRAMNECAANAFKKTDAKLGAAYKEIMSRLKGDDEKIELLKKAERAWIIFREAECNFSASGAEQGSIYPTIVSMCFDDVTKKRIVDLNTYLNCEEGDLGCSVPHAASE